VWVDPTASTGWYTTGTNPGWIKCEGGGSYTRPQGSFTIPDDKGLVMMGNDGGTDGASSGVDEITITKANLPPHGHAEDFSGASIDVVAVGGHTHGINGPFLAAAGNGRFPLLVERGENDLHNAHSSTMDSAGGHTHTATLEDMPDATDVTDENGDAFDNDAIDITPKHRNITWVMRIY
jgi:microcystin-dependent protein